MNSDHPWSGIRFLSVTCGSAPPPARSADPEPPAAPPHSAGSPRRTSPTAPGGTPGSTARWFDPAAAGWTSTSSRRLPPEDGEGTEEVKLVDGESEWCSVMNTIIIIVLLFSPNGSLQIIYTIVFKRRNIQSYII